MKPRFLIAILPAIVVLPVACDSPESIPEDDPIPPAITLGASNNGSEVELVVDQLLIICLSANPTSGYEWEVADSGKGVLTQLGPPEFTSTSQDTQRVGAGGVQTFRFRAAEAGTTSVSLVYRCPWEDGAEPDATFYVPVTVE